MPPKCPYCNEELEYAELCHNETEGNYYYETWEGRFYIEHEVEEEEE